MATVRNLIVTDEAHAERAGDVVWWSSTPGARVDVDDLAARLDAAGLTRPLHAGGRGIAAPTRLTPMEQLRRAMDKVRTREQTVRPVREGPLAGGLALVQHKPDPANQDLPAGTTVVAARHDDARGTWEHAGSDYLWIQVKTEIKTLRDHIRAADYTTWLAQEVMPRLHAVRLRKTGGFYFIPVTWEQQLSQVEAITAEVRAGEVYRLPAHTRESAMRAVIAAIREESQAVKAEVDESMVGRKSRKGLRGRLHQIDYQIDKLTEYEQILGVTLQDIRDALGQSREQAAAAMLM